MRNIKTDSAQYKDLQTPTDTDGKRRILRSLMNIHMPENIPLKDGVISVLHLADVILIIGINFQNQVSRH